MKRSNPSMNKPSVERLNNNLLRYKPNKKSNKVYTFECPRCGNTFNFMEKDLKDKVIKCDKCRYEEIFFVYNFG